MQQLLSPAQAAGKQHGEHHLPQLSSGPWVRQGLDGPEAQAPPPQSFTQDSGALWETVCHPAVVSDSRNKGFHGIGVLGQPSSSPQQKLTGFRTQTLNLNLSGKSFKVLTVREQTGGTCDVPDKVE